MRIVQGTHIDGRDKKRRYWVVPERLENLKIKQNDEAIVKTVEGYARIRIRKVIQPPTNVIRWKGGEMTVTQELLSTVKQEVDTKYIARKQREQEKELSLESKDL
jgi:hypothetical protein